MVRLVDLDWLVSQVLILGLFSRFLVRTLSIAEARLYWKNGLVVGHTSPVGTNVGLFECDFEENTGSVCKTKNKNQKCDR